MRRDMERLGLDLALKPAARRQLSAEITAQFEASGRLGWCWIMSMRTSTSTSTR